MEETKTLEEKKQNKSKLLGKLSLSLLTIIVLVVLVSAGVIYYTMWHVHGTINEAIIYSDNFNQNLNCIRGESCSTSLLWIKNSGTQDRDIILRIDNSDSVDDINFPGIVGTKSISGNETLMSFNISPGTNLSFYVTFDINQYTNETSFDVNIRR